MTTESEYRYPVSHPDVPALTWSELTPGKRFALMDTPGHIEPSTGFPVFDRPVEILRATVIGSTFEYVNTTGSLQGWPTGTKLVNLACDDGTVKTITSGQWGFGPVRTGEHGEIHGTCYCTPLT